ncbi:hypothetical protein OF83DRAFT_320134 [Amylostereum chailletii]|nr:hypothetical protein OF83DRAFT_320134 [Amylostereum chailletii]
MLRREALDPIRAEGSSPRTSGHRSISVTPPWACSGVLVLMDAPELEALRKPSAGVIPVKGSLSPCNFGTPS